MWKEIPGYANLLAGSNGEIKIKGKKRLPRISRPGWYRSIGVEGKSIREHALIALAFIGPRPRGMVINHKNGRRDDNRPKNLEYMTVRENILHAIRTGLRLTVAK